MNNPPNSPTDRTIELVSLALSVVSNDLDKGALDGDYGRELRPQAVFQIIRSALNNAKSNEDIKGFIDGLGIDNESIAEPVMTHCFIALALCHECERLIEGGDLEAALSTALEAREYAGIAFYIAAPGVANSLRIARKLESERGREHMQNHPNIKNKKVFTEWATMHIKDGAQPRNVVAIKNLSGFDAKWATTNQAIKDWWNEIPGAPGLRNGRTPKENLPATVL